MEDKVYAKNSKTKVVVSGVRDFEVGANGDIYAIAKTIIQSSSTTPLNTWQEANGHRFKLFSSDSFSSIAINNNLPIYVDNTNKIIGYGRQCVRELTVAVDSSTWALNCEKDEAGNYELIKWDPSREQWYKVIGVSGVKIGAYNEISVVVLDSRGKIYFSSDSGSF